jgi:hypothetical protein
MSVKTGHAHGGITFLNLEDETGMLNMARLPLSGQWT